MYKNSTINRLNNLELNQTMRLGTVTIKRNPTDIHPYENCYFMQKDCSGINCPKSNFIKTLTSKSI